MLPYIDIEATGKRINDLRIKQGLAIKDIQYHFEFTTPQAIYRWIHGQFLPKTDNLVVLADLFKCKIDDILIIKKRLEI